MSGTLRTLALLGVGLTSAGQAQNQPHPQLKFGGDFRLRYEHTSEGNGVPSFGKEVFRFRAGLSYAVREDVIARARLATGSQEDPNSTDITLGDFFDDLVVSLDVASIEMTRKHWSVVGGKFVNPLVSTELVWDGDVNPPGVAGKVMVGNSSRVAATLTGLYFMVDAQPGDSSSDMGGGQFSVTGAAAGKWRVTAAAGYYDYKIRSLVQTDGGDIRGNRLAPGGGRYLSDFDLMDLLGMIDYTGFGEPSPSDCWANTSTTPAPTAPTALGKPTCTSAAPRSPVMYASDTATHWRKPTGSWPRSRTTTRAWARTRRPIPSRWMASRWRGCSSTRPSTSTGLTRCRWAWLGSSRIGCASTRR
jgi:hypothetical protein